MRGGKRLQCLVSPQHLNKIRVTWSVFLQRCHSLYCNSAGHFWKATVLSVDATGPNSIIIMHEINYPCSFSNTFDQCFQKGSCSFLPTAMPSRSSSRKLQAVCMKHFVGVYMLMSAATYTSNTFFELFGSGLYFCKIQSSPLITIFKRQRNVTVITNNCYNRVH